MSNRKIAQINIKVDLLSSRFDELIDFLSERFDKMDTKIINLQNTQDYMLGELKSIKEEITVGSYRSYRMETWIEKAAKKINLPYNP